MRVENALWRKIMGTAKLVRDRSNIAHNSNPSLISRDLCVPGRDDCGLAPPQYVGNGIGFSALWASLEFGHWGQAKGIRSA